MGNTKKDVNIQALNQKAEQCLDSKSDIPMSPLWHMGKAASFGSTGNLKTLQDALDYLTCKAKAKVDFTEDEKEFLVEIYEAFWWGGKYKGYPEAAQLANHYVNGSGKKLKISSVIYEKSPIVKATMEALKEYISELITAKAYVQKIKCSDPKFMLKPYAQKLKRMNYRTEGKMKPNGVLEAAQNDHRLHKTDGHFYLEASSVIQGQGKVQTVWSVDSLYDFEPFEKHDYYTEIPLGEHKLVIYDGLSEYMTRIGAAKAFTYRAEWREIWSLKK